MNQNIGVNLKTVYLRYLEQIIKYGEYVMKDDGDTILELMYNHYLIAPPADSSEELLKAAKEGAFDIRGCPFKGESIYNYIYSFENPELDGFVYTYPNRIHKNPVNQFKVILDRLTQNPGSNRAVANIYNAALDSEEDDIPCLQWVQATIRNNKLVLHCMFRSNDIFGAFYSNMLFLSYFGLRLVEEYNKRNGTNIIFQCINYNVTSAHIYEADVSTAKRLLRQNSDYLGV